MPKKRNYNFKQLQGASSAPTSSQNGSALNKGTASVNERLGELRKVEGSEAAQVKRQLAESVNLRSIPPQLRGILGVPESEPPKPKYGTRQRIALRVAGPAPPKSWVHARSAGLVSLALRTRSGRSFRKANLSVPDRSRPKQPWRFARITGFALDSEEGDRASTLLHLSLKTAAQQWDLLDEADYPALMDLDFRLRIKLLSYIGYYGPSLDIKGFEALTQGFDPIQLLDLSGLLGHGNLTTGRLVKAFKRRTSEMPQDHAIAESWEQDDSFEAALTGSLSISRFSQLTHLCLSQPLSTVSWRDLLSLSKQTPKLTHLSLAYWPRPNLTPNLATTTVSSPRSPDVVAGGSHYYSDLEKDFSEPASVLRQLSTHLLCLQWLDLEGCTDWVPALAMHDENALISDGLGSRTGDDPWLQTSHFTNVFLDTWKNVVYLNCFQGWLPTRAGLDALPRQIMAATQRRVVLEVLKTDRDGFSLSADEDDVYETAQRKARIWADCETQAVSAGSHINAVRRMHGLRPVVMDHGWCEKYT